MATKKEQAFEAFLQGAAIREGAPDVPGIYLANALGDSTYQEPVTDYVTGWIDRQPVEQHLNEIAPEVPSARRFEFAKNDNDDTFLSEGDDIRAPYADFKKVDWKGSMVTSATQNKGLTIRLDRDNMPAGANAVERVASRLLLRVKRNELRRAFTVLDGLDGSATSVTWDATAGKDPDMDIIDSLERAADSSGIYPNTVVFGATSWTKRWRALRAQQHAGGFASSMMTPEQLADLLGVQRVVVMKERYVTKRGGTKSKIAAAQVITCYIEPSPMFDDPSNCKRFVSPTAQGGNYAVYTQEFPKFIDITVETYSKILATTTLGADELAVS